MTGRDHASPDGADVAPDLAALQDQQRDGERRLPLVTVGVPVRNGAESLEAALDSVLGQTYDHLDVVIADNCSTDATSAIAARYAETDDRVRYVRHASPLTAWGNFRFVLDQARGEFFMWASHDDLRDPDYVERLLAALLDAPATGLAFGDLVPFADPAQRLSAPVVEHDIAARARQPYRRQLADLVRSPCAEVYGLFRTRLLREYDFHDLDFSPDIPLLAYCTLRREVVHVPGPRFFQHLPQVPKDAAGRARANSYRHVRPFRYARLCWRTASSVARASRECGVHRSRVVAFLLLYAPLRASVVKTSLFTAAPPSLRTGWRMLKYGRDPHAGLAEPEELAALYGLRLRDRGATRDR